MDQEYEISMEEMVKGRRGSGNTKSRKYWNGGWDELKWEGSSHQISVKAGTRRAMRRGDYTDVELTASARNINNFGAIRGGDPK